MGLFSDLFNLLSGNNQGGFPMQEENNMENLHFSSKREDRIRQEVMMIAPRFSKNGGGIDFDEDHCDWLIINNYALPEKWKARWCRLMIVFPMSFPDTAPVGFYLNKFFRLKGNRKDEHFIGRAHDGAPDLQEFGWHWYCVRIADGAWQPQDNLWTYLNMIRESLTNDF